MDNIKLKLEVDTGNSLNDIEKLEKQLKQLNQDIKKVDEGSTEFNNLSKSIKHTEKEINRLNSGLKKNTSSVKGSNDVLNMMGKNMTNITKSMGLLPGVLFQISGALKGVSTAALTGSKSMKILKLAIASTGIGLLLVAIASLIQYFKRTEEGATKLKKIIAPFKVIFENILDILGLLGGKLVDAFTNPKQAIIDLWESIKKNFIVRIQSLTKFISAFGDVLKGVWDLDTDEIKKGIKDAGNAYLDMMTGVENSYDKATKAATKFYKENEKESKIAIQLAEDELALRKLKRQFMVDEAKLNAKISELRSKAVDDENYTKKEQLKFIKEAIKLQNKLNNDRKIIAKEELRQLEVKAKLSQSDGDTKDAIARKKAEIINLDKQNSDILKTMLSRQNTLSKSSSSYLSTIKDIKLELSDIEMDEIFDIDWGEMDSEADKAFEKMLDSEQRAFKLVKDLWKQSTEYKKDKLEQQLKDLEMAHKKGIISEKEYLNAKKILNDEYELNKYREYDKWIGKIGELQNTENQHTVLELRRIIEEQLELFGAHVEETNDQISISVDNYDKLSKSDKERLKELEKLYFKNREKFDDNEKHKTDIATAETNQRMQVAALAMTNIGQLLDIAVDKERMTARERKQMAEIQAVINIASGVLAALSQPPPYSYIMAATTAALGAVQLVKIQNQKFETGGIVNGKSHMQGGVVVELEGDEGIINKNSMRNESLRNIASTINVAGGGKDFSLGDGSINLSSESISLIVNGINNKKVYVSEQDITNTQNKVMLIDNGSTL